jgi:hypothetical protein
MTFIAGIKPIGKGMVLALRFAASDGRGCSRLGQTSPDFTGFLYVRTQSQKSSTALYKHAVRNRHRTAIPSKPIGNLAVILDRKYR